MGGGVEKGVRDVGSEGRVGGQWEFRGADGLVRWQSGVRELGQLDGVLVKCSTKGQSDLMT